ncbi:MAG: DUF3298 and DUF4163 domain-containing protein [Candidatus Obscuribacterales bacterium]|nr:DUF3298 and DUF4163 domain-containing protein [Candidatus Obscuribacterales bacterium]
MFNRQQFVERLAKVAILLFVAVSGIGASAAIAADNASSITVCSSRQQSATVQPLTVTKRTVTASFKGCEGRFAYPEIAASSTERCAALNAAIKQVIEAKLNELREHSDSFSDSNSRAVVEGSYEVRYLGGDFVSVAFYFYNYFGGGHGITENVSFNYDLRAQRELSLDDFFGVRPDYGLFSDLCRIQLFRALSGGEESMVMEGTEPTSDNFSCWFVGDKGITIKFCQYQVAPYSDGMPEVLLPYAELKANMAKNAPMDRILPSLIESKTASRLSDANYRKHQLEVEMECFVARKPEFMSVDVE